MNSNILQPLAVLAPAAGIHSMVNFMACQDYTKVHTCYSNARAVILNNNTMMNDTVKAQFSTHAWDDCLKNNACSSEDLNRYLFTMAIGTIVTIYSVCKVVRELRAFRDTAIQI